MTRWATRARKVAAFCRGGMRSLAVQVTPTISIKLPLSANARFWAGLHDDVQQISFLANHLSNGGTFFDVGANIGVYSAAVASTAVSPVRVVAFEPIPSTAAVLKETLALNKVCATIVQAAVSDTEGQIMMSAFPNARNNFRILSRASDGPSTIVPSITLDKWAADTRAIPSAIKIDVEGYELDVLTGAANTLRCHKPALCIECHAASWDQLGVCRQQFSNLLNSLGYGYIKTSDGAEPDCITAQSTFHILCLP